jgi:streptogramin lyase
MRAFLLVLAGVAVGTAAAGASTEDLRARVSPVPTSVSVRSWSPAITLTSNGRPASARLTVTIRKGAEQRSFRPRPTRRGSYRVRVTFPSDGRWSWTLRSARQTLARGAISVSTRVTFELPYDLAVTPEGNVVFLDRSRVLVFDAATRAVRIHATIATQELVALVRLGDGTLFVTDLPGGRILRVDPAGRVSPVAAVPAPADLVADAEGTTLWVASIADGVGVVRVDVASGRVEPFARPFQPHGIDRDADGDFYVHDGHSVSRIDGETGAVSSFADADAFKLLVAPDGSVYGVEGSPAGGRVVRIARDGSVTAVAGTGSLGPHRDGPALEAGILPSAVQFAPDGSLLVAQVQPVPALRSVNLSSGSISTLVRGR